MVLHPLEALRVKSPHVAAAFDWFNKIMDSMHKQHQVTKAKFLSRAFELALEKDPVKPTRVQVTLEEMATLMDIDAATARRIRDELAQDGLLKRIGNYPMFLIEPEGRRAVERMHTEGGSTLPTIVNQYNASGGSILQVATNSPHATQTANVGDQLAETRAFAERVTAKLDEIQQLITAERFVSLKADLEFLKEKLDEPKPRLPLIAQLAQGIISGLPSELMGALAGSLLG
jgi:DNA-binding transcriptional regulator YhcF (GntR family)